ncbi:MAG TPA: hypothetical protein PLK30_04300 [Blastocatellia bacterium]|nr:hypothetical protein [Blastocatellia bacterium]
MANLFRTYCSGLGNLELCILDSLLSRGMRFDELPNTHDLPFIDSLHSLFGKELLRYELSDSRYYLTSQGRKIWEAERCPQWEFFIIECGLLPIAKLIEEGLYSSIKCRPSGEEIFHFASPSMQTLERFNQSLEDSVQVIPLGSSRFEKIQVTAWLDFPEIYTKSVAVESDDGIFNSIDNLRGLWWRTAGELQPLLLNNPALS